MTDVFISYSRRDSDFARKLIDQLKYKSKDAWVDWEDVPLTSPNWWNEIKSGIENADNFLFIVTPRSMASIVCNLELDYAFDLGKRIIPVVHQEIKTRDAFASTADYKPDAAMQERLDGKDPLMIARDNWQRISHINWVFFRECDNFDAKFASLIKTIETDPDYAHDHTRYLTRATEWQRENHRADLLLFGEEIDRAETWLAQGLAYAAQQSDERVKGVNPLPQSLHREYINTSREAEKRRRRLARSAQVSIGVLALVLIVGAVAGGLIITTTQEQSVNAQSTGDVAQTLAANADATRIKLATDAYTASNIVDALRLAALAQEMFFDGEVYEVERAGHALRLVYEASLLSTDLSIQETLRSLAYQPGIRMYLTEHDDPIYSVAFSPDGNTALSSSEGNTLILWDLQTGTEIRRLRGHTARVHSVAFQTANTAISASLDGALIRWNTDSGIALERYEGIETGSSNIAFSPDGTTILMGTSDGLLLLRSVDESVPIRRFEGHDSTITIVVFSSDGTQAISGAINGTLILWDVATGEELKRLEGHNSIISNVTLSSNGVNALSSAEDLILWNLSTGEESHRLEGHATRVTSVAFSPDGTTALSGSEDGIMIHWDVASGDIIQLFQSHNETLWTIAFSPDGTNVLSGSEDGVLILWDIVKGNLIRRVRHNSAVYTAAFSPNDNTALSGSQDRKLILWDTRTGEMLGLLEGHTNFVSSVAFDSDGTHAISGSRDKTLILWNIRTGEILNQLIGHDNVVNSVTFNPDGARVISGSADETLILWDTNTGEIIRRFEGHVADVTSVAFSPDGIHVLSGSADETLILWDTNTGEIIRRFEGHVSGVTTVAFHPDNKIVSSGTEDGVLILWDLDNGQIISYIEGHSDRVSSVSFSPNGEMMLSSSLDNTLMFWRVDTIEQLQKWMLENRHMPELTCSERISYGLPENARCVTDESPVSTPTPATD